VSPRSRPCDRTQSHGKATAAEPPTLRIFRARSSFTALPERRITPVLMRHEGQYMNWNRAEQRVMGQLRRELRGKAFLTRPLLTRRLYGPRPSSDVPPYDPKRVAYESDVRSLSRILGRFEKWDQVSSFRTDDGGAVCTLPENAKRWPSVENQIRRTNALGREAFYVPVRFPEGPRPIRVILGEHPLPHEKGWTCLDGAGRPRPCSSRRVGAVARREEEAQLKPRR